MKTLIVFYSLTGNTKKIAEAVTGATAGEVLEIKTKKEMPVKGFMKYWVGGKQVMKKESPEIMPLDKNPNDYGLIFLGTPVWAGNFVPAIRSFLAQAKLQNKKIALFSAHGGDNPGQAFVNLEKELAGNEIVGKLDFKIDMVPEAQVEKNVKQAAEWSREMVKNVSN